MNDFDLGAYGFGISFSYVLFHKFGPFCCSTPGIWKKKKQWVIGLQTKTEHNVQMFNLPFNACVSISVMFRGVCFQVNDSELLFFESALKI